MLLHEGGPILFGDFVAHGCVDELFLTVAPQLAGRDVKRQRPGVISGAEFLPQTAPWLRIVSVKQSSSHLYLRYEVRGTVQRRQARQRRWRKVASFDWINRGAAARSSSGRFIAKAAASLPCRNHQTLKLLLDRSPRSTISSAPEESPQNS